MHPVSKSAGQSSSGTRASGNFGSYQGAVAGRPVTEPYSASSDVYVVTPVLASGLSQPVLQADPRFSGTSSSLPAQLAVQASGIPQAVQNAPALSSLSSGLPATGYSTVNYVPVDVGSDVGALQPGAAQSGPQGKSFAWSVDGPKFNAGKPEGLRALLCYEAETCCV